MSAIEINNLSAGELLSLNSPPPHPTNKLYTVDKHLLATVLGMWVKLGAIANIQKKIGQKMRLVLSYVPVSFMADLEQLHKQT